MVKNRSKRIYGFVKMMDHKDLRPIKKGLNKIENEGEIWYTIIKNRQMTEFGETLGKL